MSKFISVKVFRGNFPEEVAEYKMTEGEEGGIKIERIK